MRHRCFSRLGLLRFLIIWGNIILSSIHYCNGSSAIFTYHRNDNNNYYAPTTTLKQIRSGSAKVVKTSNVNSMNTSILQKLIAGGASRAIAQMTLYPIDALRTLAQTRDGRTLADVGASALLRGCTTTSSFALFMGSIQFAIFGICRNYGINTLVSSALGAAASCIVSVPQEVIKQRLVTGVYSSFREAVTMIYRTEGIRGYYSAWKPTMIRNVPFVMTTFTSMEILKKNLLKRKQSNNNEELSLVENMIIGMSSALIAGLLTQPVDTIKTRMMTQAASKAIPYKSAIDCLVTIIRTEGILTLYSGLKQRSTYMCLLWGITFALNGQFNRVMYNHSVTTTTRKRE